jgi:hypothetical protein
MMEAATIGHLPAPPRLSREEVRERAHEKRESLIDDARAFVRALHYLQHTRASKARAGLPLSWRDAEAALYGRAGTIVHTCDQALRRVARKAAA